MFLALIGFCCPPTCLSVAQEPTASPGMAPPAASISHRHTRQAVDFSQDSEASAYRKVSEKSLLYRICKIWTASRVSAGCKSQRGSKLRAPETDRLRPKMSPLKRRSLQSFVVAIFLTIRKNLSYYTTCALLGGYDSA